jgi:two-component system LytT family response regulator
MIKAIIIDDELHCSKRLELMLADANAIELCGSFQTVDDGLKAIKQIKPQLVFLDVEINNETGFHLLQKLPVISFDVIFTTAYDKYAVQAFKFSAVDYLLKPIDEFELNESINKLQEKISEKEKTKKLETLFYNISVTNNKSKKICVPVMTGIEFISLNNIIRCESNINYTTLFMKDKQKLTVSKTLKEFEELLREYNFFRVHNSHLINLDYIKKYNKGHGGTVIMDDGSEIEVSVRRKDEFLKQLTD